jgi:uncharacterized Zn-binding protein involved in type VI secretion
MSAILLTGDIAGGAILPPIQTSVLVNGIPVATVGTKITAHGEFPHGPPPPGYLPFMVTGSSIVKINGVPVCRNGDLASCGHVAISTNTMVFIK